MDERDRDWVDLVAMASGEVEATARLYDRHAPRMAAVAQAVADPERSGDAVREAFAELRRRLTTYDPRVQGPIAAWVLRLARERALVAIAGRQRLESEELTARPRAEGAPMDPAAAEAVDALPALTRQALLGAWLEDLAPRALAARLEVDEARAVAWLREGLLALGAAPAPKELV